MNGAMITSALNGAMVDNEFIPLSEVDELTWECDHCGERHLNPAPNFTIDGETWCEECVEVDSFYCQRCGTRHSTDNEFRVRSFDGVERWCEYCVDNHTVTCEVCGDVVDDNYYIEDDGIMICDSCLEEMEQCDVCGHYHRPEDMTRVRGGENVCEGCRDANYYRCPECDEWVHMDDWDGVHNMCNDCYRAQTEPEDSNDRPRSENAVVRPYHSRPLIQFVGAPNVLNNTAHAGIGVELEVDVRDGERPTYKQRALNRIDRIAGDRVYFNADCSLRGGFEIITQPHTLEAFNEIPWAEIMDACTENGFSSHDAGTCGLHIHFSRLMFGEDEETQDDNISKLVQFFEFYWDDMVKVSRRESGQLHWCNKRGYVSKKRIKKYVKDKRGSHGEAINNANRNTVEIRIMRGTLKIETFNACVDTCVTLVKNACAIDWGDVSDAAEMLRGIKPETLDYLRRRNAFAAEIGDIETSR